MTSKRQKAGARRPTRALARRTSTKPARGVIAINPSVGDRLKIAAERLQAGQLPAALDEGIQLGQYGLVELKFTAAEELVLSEPVNADEIRVRPDGAIYLPHVVYTRWLNRAFGRTGWALRPASKPLLNNNTVVVPYVLHIHRKPVAFALGEQDYFATNKTQSYGDALESTVASGLRRTCKHLGIGLELWDRTYADAYLQQFAVRVKCQVQEQGQTKNRYQWRRLVDPKFRNEVAAGRRVDSEPHDEARPVLPVAYHGDLDAPITDGQVLRFWTIARRRGRSDGEIKDYLRSLGYDSSKHIKRRDYETVCAAMEHPGPLSAREPGQDG